MDELENIRHNLCRLDDMVNSVEHKIHSLSGVLELVYMGMQAVNKSEDSYELSSVEFIRDYLKAIEKMDIQEMHDCLAKMKEEI